MMKRPVFNLTRKYFNPDQKVHKFKMKSPGLETKQTADMGLNVQKAKLFGKRANSITNPSLLD